MVIGEANGKSSTFTFTHTHTQTHTVWAPCGLTEFVH